MIVRKQKSWKKVVRIKKDDGNTSRDVNFRHYTLRSVNDLLVRSISPTRYFQASESAPHSPSHSSGDIVPV